MLCNFVAILSGKHWRDTSISSFIFGGLFRAGDFWLVYLFAVQYSFVSFFVSFNWKYFQIDFIEQKSCVLLCRNRLKKICSFSSPVACL